MFWGTKEEERVDKKKKKQSIKIKGFIYFFREMVIVV
jgi:hypothetical protein